MPPENDNALAPPAAPAAPAEPAAPAAPAEPAAPAAAAPPAEPAAPAAPATPDDESDAGRRIRGLLAENKALQEYSLHWRGLALERGGPPAAAPKEPAVDAMPKLKDFDSTEKWADAHSAWTAREIQRGVAAGVDTTLRTRQESTDRESVADTYRARMDEFEKIEPGARMIVANPVMTRAINAQPAIAEVVMASERGPDLAVHLSKNPTELVRISRLPAAQAAAALGRIEAALPARTAAAAPKTTPAAAAPTTPKGSRAPEPPTPIGAGGTPTVDDMNLPLGDFLKKLNRR